ANTEREARLAARSRARTRYRATDPLWVAAGLLLAQAELELRDLGAGQYRAGAPDGREGTAWSTFTRDGRHLHVFVFDDVALLCHKEKLDAEALRAAFREQEKYEPSPPTTSDEVPPALRTRKRYLDFVGKRELSAYREIARVSGKDIADAIELS